MKQLKNKQNLYLIQGKRHQERAVFVDPSVIAELKKNHWQPQQTNRFSFAHFLQKVKKELNISKNIQLRDYQSQILHQERLFARIESRRQGRILLERKLNSIVVLVVISVLTVKLIIQ